jgi:polynucleotide kinase-phosphatase
MMIEIPHGALVVLIGPSGAGKSSFAASNFLPTEIVSSDACRGLVSDNENNQTVSRQAFELVHYIARSRLALHRLTVIDATSVRREDRRPLIELAREFHVLPVAIVFDIAEKICHERNSKRPDRDFGPHVVRRQRREMLRGLRNLEREGFRYVFTLSSPADVEAAEVVRTPLWTDRRALAGPFDIIGDIHGCYDELRHLLEELGYGIAEVDGRMQVDPPEGRMAIFLGDYGDRGPKTPEVYRLVMSMVAAGTALALPGNHDVKLGRHLDGRNVRINHGLAETIDQFGRLSGEEIEEIRAFVQSLVSHYVLDDGRLVVAHAGLPEELQGRSSRTVRDVALYGVTTGRVDDYDLPERLDWAADYRGGALVVYGHTPVAEPIWSNGTINIDSGCVFGGSLTALRYPERTLVTVPALRTYFDSPRPILPATTASSDKDQLLDVADYLGRQTIQTRLLGNISINELNAAAALETMARFAIDPRLLVYLPPTMSPPETSRLDGMLEHPAEAFAYYRERGVSEVICQTKHMGSRAIVVVGRDPESFGRRFRITHDSLGIVYTRTGRRFFNDRDLESALLEGLSEALAAKGFWSEHETDWLALDCEIMPWSLKAGSLIEQQYAAVGTAAVAALESSISALDSTARRGIDVGDLQQRESERLASANKYVDAYKNYIWPVDDLTDLRLSPFHVLATEGRTYFEQPHDWHMKTIAAISDSGSGFLHPTEHRVVNVLEEDSVGSAVDWWTRMCAAGGEGMVVKPLAGLARAEGRLIQPALKVRGPNYLRIIYGPDYDRPENLSQLRRRSAGRKRGLAVREFALGVEALERFVRREPLRRTHECVFGVLALESEPIDPRL